jgi:hypothetical protein
VNRCVEARRDGFGVAGPGGAHVERSGRRHGPYSGLRSRSRRS